MTKWHVVGRIVCVLLLAAALACLLRTPFLALWYVQLGMTELGHWLIPVPVLVLAASLRRRFWGGVALALLTGVAVLRPALLAVWEGGWVAGAAQMRWDTLPGPPPFSWRRLWTLPGTPSVQGQTVEFSTAGDVRLKADVFRDSTESLRPVVIVLHGGGWDSGSRVQLAASNARIAAANECAVVAMDYRLAPEHRWPAPREDVQACLRYLTEHASLWRLDLTRVVLLGRSAGAQIALATAYTEPWPELRGVVSFYGPADLEFAYEYGSDDDVLKSRGLVRRYLGGEPVQVPAAYRSSSAIFHVTPATVPTLLVHGEKDGLVWHRQSERLAKVLNEQRVPHQFVSMSWAVHAFDFLPNGPGGQTSAYAVSAFLRRVFAPGTESGSKFPAPRAE